MNYYYDVILNWNEQDAYNFYEWNDIDYLELVKKIPLFKIKHKTFIDICENNIKINQDFLELIKDKTLICGKNIINKINYACLFTDTKNVIAIEFNEEGTSISRSKLLIDDELNLIETLYNLKEIVINYEIIENLKLNKKLRQEIEAKRLITLEINNLYQNKEFSKLRYLFYEYKKEQNDNIDLIYKNIINDLNEDITEEILKLYYIIKLSYHNV
ncbi:MAG: DUF3603 family protein [Firmicutes bacterium]|nr:DUF3603 family protein [Bacillota bacterium]